MEALQPLSVESFSYRWLISIKTSSSSFDASDDANDLSSFIDIDPKLMSLRMAAAEAAYEFDFGLSTSQQPAEPTHADHIISDDLLFPLQITPQRENEKKSDSPDSVLRRSLSVDSSRVDLLSLSKRNRFRDCSYSTPSRPVSEGSTPMLLRPSSEPSRGSSLRNKGGVKLDLFGNCSRSSKRILKKYLCFLVPLYKKVKELSSSGLGGGARKRCDGGGFSSIDWCRPTKASFDVGVEKSIHDAVLHCKKSIGRDE